MIPLPCFAPGSWNSAPRKLVIVATAILALLPAFGDGAPVYLLNPDGIFTKGAGEQIAIANLAETGISIRQANLPSGIDLNEGSLQLEIVMPETTREEEQLLVRLEGENGAIELGIQRGMIAAGIGDNFGPLPTIIDRVSQAWRAGDAHSVELRWMAYNQEVLAVLLSDGQVSGTAMIEKIPTLAGGTLILGANAGKGVLKRLILNPAPEFPQSLLPGARTIHVDVASSRGEAYPFWSVANWNQPHLLSNAHVMEEMARLKPFISEINCVYLLGGRWEGENEWYQGLDADGQVLADFSGMIEQLEGVLAAGYKPRIVLDNVPFGMSDPVTLHAFGNTAPPFDEAVWGQYVEMAVRSMVEAFGREEVATWLFRVGTEPDLNPGHWSGSAERFLEHYDHTVEAVVRVLPEAKIGPGNILNPAVSDKGLELGMKWGLSIIDHAAEGQNAVTGRQGSRLDWFSYTWYGRVGSTLDLFENAYLRTRGWLDKYPQFKDVPIAIGEFAVLGDEFGRRLYAGDASEWAASFYAAMAEKTYAFGIEQVYEWDQTTYGVYHPRGHVVAMLDRMHGGDLLEVTVDAHSSARAGAIATRKDNRLYVLLFNHRPWRSPKIAEKVRLSLANIDAVGDVDGRWRISEWVINESNSVWIREFEADAEAAGLERRPRAGSFEGSPFRSFGDKGVKLFKKNIDRYRELAALPMTRHAEVLELTNGQAMIEFELEGHSVRFLEIWPAEPSSAAQAQ